MVHALAHVAAINPWCRPASDRVLESRRCQHSRVESSRLPRTQRWRTRRTLGWCRNPVHFASISAGAQTGICSAC